MKLIYELIRFLGNVEASLTVLYYYNLYAFYYFDSEVHGCAYGIHVELSNIIYLRHRKLALFM